jgi:hypothetical protein
MNDVKPGTKMNQTDWVPVKCPQPKKEVDDDVKGLLAFLGLWIAVFITHTAYFAGSIGN